ncbi:ATP-binding protein [Streptomyces sp. NPDC050743]|uniref:ATP-binding protein n=1 Tax=Streptomyces sp. NPDC050743 TaxID=3365634 RepID=UPI0037A9139B
MAQALSRQAVRQGADVRFAKTTRILAELAGGHADRTWDKRIRELIRPDLLILDDFTMRQLSASQADDLYELASERQGTLSDHRQQPGAQERVSPLPRSSPSHYWTDRSTPAIR